MYVQKYFQGSAPAEVASVIYPRQTEPEDELNALPNTLTTPYTTLTT